MPSLDDPEAILALIPHLRAFARTLDPDPARADALVRDALEATLGEWRPAATAAGLRARIEARLAGAADAASSASVGEA